MIKFLRYPKPVVTWKKAIGSLPGEYKDFLYEPNVSLDANGSIHFTKITKESQGHFLCEAKNNIGTGVSKVIFLKVNGKFNYKNVFRFCQVTYQLFQYLLIFLQRTNRYL